MTDHIHAVPLGQAAHKGQCGWRWHWSGVDLRCDEPAIPGSSYCAAHLIELHDEEDTR